MSQQYIKTQTKARSNDLADVCTYIRQAILIVYLVRASLSQTRVSRCPIISKAAGSENSPVGFFTRTVPSKERTSLQKERRKKRRHRGDQKKRKRTAKNLGRFTAEFEVGPCLPTYRMLLAGFWARPRPSRRAEL